MNAWFSKIAPYLNAFTEAGQQFPFSSLQVICFITMRVSERGGIHLCKNTTNRNTFYPQFKVEQ